MEPGEGEPGLIPQEDEVGLDGQALLHHPAHVVDDPVERAVGQQQHLDPVQLARSPQGQQLALDLGERDGTVHGVLVQRIRLEVGHHRAGQHQPVVVGLVAVPVNQDDVAGLDDGLHDDLVGRRGAVGDEVGLPRAERLGRELLSLAEWPGRLEQRVETTAGRGGFGQEDFQAVEVDHVLDPVRVDDRLAVRDRQCVEHPGGPVAVVTQRAEERGTIPRRDAVQDGQVQLERTFPGMEDAPEMVAEPAGQILDGDLRHQVQVEFGPDPGQRSGEYLSAVIRRMVHQVVSSVDTRERCEQGRVVAGPVGEPAADHARLQPEVQPRGHDRLIETGHHDDLVDELVVRAAPPP